MIKVLPQDDRVLIELDSIDEKQIGHVFISGTRSEKCRFGTVVEEGQGGLDADYERHPPKYEKGDRIMISWWTGTIVYIFENEWYDTCHRILREDEILAKVEE